MDDELIDRRRFLARFCAGVTAVPAFTLAGMWAPSGVVPRETSMLWAAATSVRGSAQTSSRDPIPPDQTLRARAAAKGLFYGTTATRWVLEHNPDFAARVAAECGILVPESELKWSRVHPEPNRYDFAGADWLLELARSHGMLFRGHTLIYFQNEPTWVTAGSAADTEQAVRDHVRTVAGRYAGRVHSWDVVNEILELNDHRNDGLRASPLLKHLGPEFVPLAFRTAAEADSKALLTWNENQLEYDVAYQEARREAVLKLLQGWRAAGVPVQALGIQSHLRQHATTFDPKRYRAFLQQVAGLGVKIIISELDVFDADLPADPVLRDRAVADAYEQYLTAALDEPAVIGVVTWGLSDRSTWLASYRPRRDGSAARPLPLDADLKPKAAWQAIARAFDGASPRTTTHQ